MDLAKAADIVIATIETLQDFRQDVAWDHLYEYVVSIADLYGIEQIQE